MATRMKRTELKRGPGPDRKTPIKPRNHKRAKKRQEEVSGDYGAWLRDQWCDVTKRTRDLVAAHVGHTRAAGGGQEDMVPLHAEVEADWHGLDEAKFAAKWKRSKDSVRERCPLWRMRWECEVRGERFEVEF